jgi:hypothetical protein
LIALLLCALTPLPAATRGVDSLRNSIMNQKDAPTRCASKPRPFDPLLKAVNATREQRAEILRNYYDRKITYSLPKKTLTLTFGDELNVINLAKMSEAEHCVSLMIQLTRRAYLSRRDIREILSRIVVIKKMRNWFYFCDENLNLKKAKPQAKPAVA